MPTTYRMEKITTHGDLTVYRRCWNEPGMRKYAVYRESDGRCLEEFRRKPSAVRWAIDNA